MPSLPRLGSTVAKRTMTSARSPLEMKVFSPLTMYSAPSSRAVVRIDATSEPALGSVKAIDPIAEPSHSRGIHALACAGVPCR